MRLHHYHRGENGSAISGAWSLYVGDGSNRFKGWYSLLPGRRSHGNYAEVVFAIGGEDNMVQIGGRLPLLGCCFVGVRIPRALTRSWIYERREWGMKVGYIGNWLDVLIAYDDSARDMSSYYSRQRERGEEVRPSKIETWPGFCITLDPRIRDRIFGRRTRLSEEALEKDVPCVVPMPEGNYAATATVTRSVRGRRRWKPGQVTNTETWVDIPHGVPVPGKGENSWDCEDDGIYGAGANGDSIGAACAKVAASALRTREQHGSGASWVPDKGWPEGIARDRAAASRDQQEPTT